MLKFNGEQTTEPLNKFTLNISLQNVQITLYYENGDQSTPHLIEKH